MSLKSNINEKFKYYVLYIVLGDKMKRKRKISDILLLKFMAAILEEIRVVARKEVIKDGET